MSHFCIAQLSDLHCGGPRFDAGMLDRVLDSINERGPDLVVVPGDLTADGYLDQFEEAKSYLDRIECPHVAILIGNHDARNVGYVLFDRLFGERYRTWDFTLRVDAPDSENADECISVIGVDSSKPDLDDGELGRHRHSWLKEQLRAARGVKIVALHHHLITIPGTGRERNIVWDAGEVLELLTTHDVALVLAGHKHVPYIWPVGGTLLVTSGTASTWRTRGDSPPSFNFIDIDPERIVVTMVNAADGSLTPFAYRRPRRGADSPESSSPEEPGGLLIEQDS